VNNINVNSCPTSLNSLEEKKKQWLICNLQPSMTTRMTERKKGTINRATNRKERCVRDAFSLDNGDGNVVGGIET
jgi:hypothetical protein